MAQLAVDFASVDGNKNINFVRAAQAGTRLMIPRAVYGRPVTTGSTTPFIDPAWKESNASIRAAGMKCSGYLFVCFPRKGLFTPTPDIQAQALIDYCKLTPNVDWVPAIDVEEESDILSPDEMYAWVVRTAKTVRQGFGAWPLLYFSNRVWVEYFKNHAAGELINCLPWIAKPWPYPVGSQVHLDGAPGYLPTYVPEWGNACGLYQYQGDAKGYPGFSSTVDISRIEVVGPGATGEQVKWIQRRLGNVAVDGVYGPATEKAVKALQASHGLAADGIIGVDTYTYLLWAHS